MHMTEGLAGHKESIPRWRSGHGLFVNRPFSLEFLESLRFFLEISHNKIKGIYKAS